MKTYEIDGMKYFVTGCTAIARWEVGNEAMRETAVLVADDEGGRFVVFGWTESELNEEAFSSMLEDESAWEPLSEDNQIVLPGDYECPALEVRFHTGAGDYIVDLTLPRRYPGQDPKERRLHLNRYEAELMMWED